jgi:RHS repeat-associated protein
VVQTYEYDSFGNLKDMKNRVKQPYSYTGREYDRETNLYYYRARYYDAQVGRFVSKDPISFAGGDVNLYGYVQSNSINLIDPSGMEWSDIPGAISKAFQGAAGAISDIAQNGPPAAQGLLVFAVATEAVPLAVAAAPSAACSLANGYRAGMAAAGTGTGATIVKNAPDFISAHLPGPPAPNTAGGAGFLSSTILGVMGFEIK